MKTHILIYCFALVFLMLFGACEKSVFLEKENTERPVLSVAQGNRQVSNEVYVHSFAEVRIGKKALASFSIANRGTKNLEIGNLNSDSKYFTVSKPAKQILAPGEYVNFTVTFAPEKWGEEIAKVSFFSNDPKNNTFSFLLMGSGALSASFRTDSFKVEYPEGVNTVPFNDADGNGTRFITSVSINDPNNVLTKDVKVIVNLTFEDGTKGQITKTMYETGPGVLKFENGVLAFGFSVRYGSKNTYVDVEAYMLFPSGERSNTLKYRIVRPLGAN
jgi:hypothetical protein